MIGRRLGCSALAMTMTIGACSWSLPDAATIAHEPATPCTTATRLPGSDLAAVVAGVALIAVGGRIAFEPSPEGEPTSGLPFFLVLGVPGALVVVFAGRSAKHGFDSVDACRQRAALGPAVPASPEAKLLADLTASARNKARAGDCDTARVLAERVRELDPDYYRVSVVPDPVIARCWSLDAPTTPTP